MPKDEFAGVQHAFMSDVSNEDRNKEKLTKYIGNYRYTGILRKDGTRDIIRKDRMK